MPDEPGAARKLRSHIVVEIVLVAALLVYLVMAQSRVVGDDLSFTVVGASLMALVTYWTLNTLRDGLELIAVRARRIRH
ncbi:MULTISPECIES: hypothetical protein [Marinobacter]|uniref:Chlorhexidine efflux transporter domain-containing protein n=1 Tax=Marinobacter profundi TaxID=2666256 RepID=A0A2G1ULD9_9GAMM|nr:MULTISPECIES: hypothetical protein [Marinobacter]MBD3658476.1 hypothetical protein [Marinobacter sp.]PHQ15249.1 hypothetical protein CLH61_08925 [Marinobacter profundi]